jgi:hypothetical protein
MKIIYKKKPEGHYDRILKELEFRFPDRKFRIMKEMGEIYEHEVGIEECISNTIARILWDGYWKELDLEAMGLE